MILRAAFVVLWIVVGAILGAYLTYSPTNPDFHIGIAGPDATVVGEPFKIAISVRSAPEEDFKIRAIYISNSAFEIAEMISFTPSPTAASVVDGANGFHFASDYLLDSSNQDFVLEFRAKQPGSRMPRVRVHGFDDECAEATMWIEVIAKRETNA